MFKRRLHDPRTATVIGRLLGAAILTAFVTGLISHYLQQPPGWAANLLPSRPSWGYRLTQGLHVASGIASIPLLFAKLWTVYPRLFEWPPVRSVVHALERLSIGVLVGSVLLQLLTGLLNTLQWYPWPWNFRHHRRLPHGGGPPHAATAGAPGQRLGASAGLRTEPGHRPRHGGRPRVGLARRTTNPPAQADRPLCRGVTPVSCG